tara:strand:- start:180 stop:314 length:135 start_codon:yes stop_codon:yes gene_type:complete
MVLVRFGDHFKFPKIIELFPPVEKLVFPHQPVFLVPEHHVQKEK